MLLSRSLVGARYKSLYAHSCGLWTPDLSLNVQHQVVTGRVTNRIELNVVSGAYKRLQPAKLPVVRRRYAKSTGKVLDMAKTRLRSSHKKS